jgi:uncharacterized protein with von Willebrand factor type A (vWA) domain
LDLLRRSARDAPEYHLIRRTVSVLLHNLVRFGRLLHSLGLAVHAGRMLDVASALEHIDIGRRADFYFTLRALLVHRQQDLAVFDEAFRAFWRPRSDGAASSDGRALGRLRPYGPRAPDVHPGTGDSSPASDALDLTVYRGAPMSYSAGEVSRLKDFAEFTEEELEQARSLIAAMTWHLGERRTRRWAPGRSATIDLRRLFRRSMKHGGEALTLPTRRRMVKPRPLVLVCDVSGSMDRYARLLIHFVYGLAGGLEHVEAFVFATRLTRVTRELRARDAHRALARVPRLVPDWAGGTRIGDALHELNVRWARQVLAHGPIVLLISDGWDRGDPERLAREMARLQRSCYRLIWLNPLLGSAEYRPLTRGMQAALPFVDDFLPVHNLTSLEALAAHVRGLSTRGSSGVRRTPAESSRSRRRSG